MLLLKSATSPLGTIDMEETDLGILEEDAEVGMAPPAALAAATAPTAAAELLAVVKLPVDSGLETGSLPAVMVGEPIEKLASELASDSQRELRLVTML